MQPPATDRDFARCPACGAPIDMTDPRQIARHRMPGHEEAVPPVPGLDRGGLIEENDHADEVGYFETCQLCWQTYDTRNSAEVSHHTEPGHQPLLPVT